jgi:hypothetical protein
LSRITSGSGNRKKRDGRAGGASGDWSDGVTNDKARSVKGALGGAPSAVVDPVGGVALEQKRGEGAVRGHMEEDGGEERDERGVFESECRGMQLAGSEKGPNPVAQAAEILCGAWEGRG